jgi:hypothetical protein
MSDYNGRCAVYLNGRSSSRVRESDEGRREPRYICLGETFILRLNCTVSLLKLCTENTKLVSFASCRHTSIQLHNYVGMCDVHSCILMGAFVTYIAAYLWWHVWRTQLHTYGGMCDVHSCIYMVACVTYIAAYIYDGMCDVHRCIYMGACVTYIAAYIYDGMCDVHRCIYMGACVTYIAAYIWGHVWRT